MLSHCPPLRFAPVNSNVTVDATMSPLPAQVPRDFAALTPYRSSANIELNNMTCERSRASGTIRPTLKTVHLQLSALPLATRPLATARPCHARPTHQPSVSPATQRPTSPNFASGGHEKPLPGTARALPRKVENRQKTQIPPSSWRTTGVPLWRVLPYCCAAIVDWSVRTALLLLVGGWMVGGGCLVGGGSLAIHEMAGGRKTTNLPAFPTVLRVLKTPEPTKRSSRTGIPPYILLHCCTAVEAWSVGGGGARGWVERVV